MNIIPFMADKSVQMVLTDIPYAECNKQSNGLRTIDKRDADTLTFDLGHFLEEITRVTSGSIYIFCGIQQVSPIYSFFRKNKMVTRHCVWHKTNPSPLNGSYTWLSAIENCVFAKHGRALFKPSCEHNMWTFPSGSSKIHPTQKPIKLMMKLIEASSEPNDLVFDPCMGSGSTVVAAIHSGRHYIGVELNQDWYKVAQQQLISARNRTFFD